MDSRQLPSRRRGSWLGAVGLLLVACAGDPVGDVASPDVEPGVASTATTAATTATVPETTTVPRTTSTTVGPPDGADIALVASEHRDDPVRTAGFAFHGDDVTAEAPELTVPAGEPVTVWLVNLHGQYSSSLDSHDFAVIPQLDDVPTLAAGGQLLEEILWGSHIEKLFSGQSASVTFVPDTPGDYL